MPYFTPNMEIPQEYLDVLIEISEEQGVSAEQYAKQIIMSFIGKNCSRGLTKAKTRV
tara:strand:- start:79 stop:249 length:171 start_codon:yes stop_codon:yes gene_type:complete